MNQMAVYALPERCIGCRQCELICSFEKEKVYSPQLARIRVVQVESKSLSVPVTCAYCEKPVCEEVCPTDAMIFDRKTKSAKVITELCIGCKECVNACPLGAVEISTKTGASIRCDLCEGDPACVKVCPVDALKFGLYQHTAEIKRRERTEAMKLD